MTIYLLGPLTQIIVLGLNISDTPILCMYMLSEPLLITSQLANIVPDSFPKNSSLVHIETIQSNHSIISCMNIGSIRNIGIPKEIH